MAADIGETKARVIRLGPFTRTQMLESTGATAALSALALLAAVAFAARAVRQRWQELPPPFWQARLQAVLCTPVFWVAFLHRWMRRKLERNPIGWLGQRSWSGRLVTWGWLAVVISVYSLALTDTVSSRYFAGLQHSIAWLLLVSLAATAAGSFRRERENGVLELLLVSPLLEGQILGGRLRGLWGQFLPAMGLLLGVWFYLEFLVEGRGGSVGVGFFAVSFLTLPVVGLYYSLRQENFLSAFLFTVVMGLLAPVLVQQAIALLVELFEPSAFQVYGGAAGLRYRGSTPFAVPVPFGLLGLVRSNVVAVGWQLACAGWLGLRLHRALLQRNFNFNRRVT